MNLKPLVFVAMAVCAPGLACATQTAFAEFRLDAPPSFALDSAASTGSGTVGHWTQANEMTAGSVASWEVDDYTVLEHSPYSNLPNIDPGSIAGAPFGKGTFDWSGEQTNEHGVVGKAQAEGGFMRADVTLSRTDLEVRGQTDISWVRTFQLNPHSSVTLSGLSNFSNSGLGETQTDYFYTPQSDSDSASALLDFYTNSVGDGYNHARVRLSGDLHVKDVSASGDHAYPDASAFSYSTGPDGRLALTLTNSSDSVMEGKFSASVHAAASTEITLIPAVPEPHTWLMLGLGVLSIVARKNRKRSTAVA